MADIFSGSEVVELGIQIEENGRDFYKTLADQARDIKLRELFGFLSHEEEKHIAVFKGILKEGSLGKGLSVSSDEYLAYMNSLASNYVFTKENTGKSVALSVKSQEEGIEKAIGFEKESITFYEGLRKIVPGKERSSVDFLIEQERTHLNKLSGMLNRLQKGI